MNKNTIAKQNVIRITSFKINCRRLLGLIMLISLLITANPFAATASLPQSCNVPPRQMPAHPIKKSEKKKTAPNIHNLSFSDQPTDLELCRARVLPQLLTPMHTEPVSGENSALAHALIAFKAQTDRDDVSDLTKFVNRFPKSRWRAAVKLNIGMRRFAAGYLTEALQAWHDAWSIAKDETNKAQKSVADEALAQLALLDARLGRKDELDSYLAIAEKRKLSGSIEQKVYEAKQGSTCMSHNPGIAFKCGPYALEGLLSAEKGKCVHSPLMFKAQSSSQGTNLAQLKNWSDQLGLHCQIAKRSKGAPVIVPSVMHWKLGHFATVVKNENGRFLTKDPTFSKAGNLSLSESALDAETDGYFLVPDQPLPEGWQKVEKEEAQNVWGKGYSGGTDPPCANQPKVGGSCSVSSGAPPASPSNGPGIWGLAKAAAYSLQATLNIQDVPLGYKPPVGPAISCLVNYNDMESGQPAEFTFTNLGPDWSLNWVSYLTVDESGNATIHTAGGGTEYYAYTDGAYSNGLYSNCQLTVSDGIYELQDIDGSIRVFNQNDGSGNVFMSQMIDSRGNSTTISFDEDFRITSITDAIGQETILTYGSDTYGDGGFYVVTQITDPFGRSCSFSFDESFTYLLSITDVLGMQSQFHYTTDSADSSFIDRMTTPYGTTGFLSLSSLTADGTGLQIAYPDGTTSAVINQGGSNSQTLFWDREQMSLYPSDVLELNTGHYTLTRWCFEDGEGSNQTAVPYFVTPPLDSQITYSYPGGEPEPDDSNYYFLSGSSLPSSVSRNSDGQTYQFEYTPQGNLSQSTDPLSRQFTYTYADNGIDLLKKQQTQTEIADIDGVWADYTQHLPGSYTDGSGQVTTLTYNAQGQILTRTDASDNIWSMTYDGDGYLTQAKGPLSGSRDIVSLSYDGFGRVYQATDAEGYTLTYSYDAADRVTQVTFPDGTTTQTIYDKLDAVLTKDRLGRWSQLSYDSMDQLAYQVDPLGRKTTYSWCNCGSIRSQTDPNGNTTSWQHDLEGRIVQKVYQDGSPWIYAYDPEGRVSNLTDPQGQQTTYLYNLDDTISSKFYSYAVNDTSTVNYSYDPSYLRLTSVTSGWGTNSYSYNPYITALGSTTSGAGQISEITNDVIPNSNITYSYDVLGRQTNRSINGPINSSSWSYDADSRVTSETNPLGEFNYAYVDDALGYSKGTTRLSTISYPNGQVTSFNWLGNQGDQKLQGIINLTSDGTCLSQFGYGYDSAGEITAWQQQLGPETHRIAKLSYDLAGQLISSQVGAPGSISPTYLTQNFYSYDAAGNRIGAQQFAQNYFFLYGSTTAGDTVSMIISNGGLFDGQETISYTVGSGDDLTAVVSGLTAAINADSSLSSIGINANSSGVFLYIYSASTNVTSYSTTSSAGATEFVSGATYINAPVNITTVGTPTEGDVLYVTVNNPTLSGGNETVNYTVESGDTLVSIAEGLSESINADSNLSSIGVSASNIEGSAQIYADNFYVTTYTQSISDGATEGIVFSLNTNVIHNATVGGTTTTGDILTVTVYDSALIGGSETVTYTVESGDTAASIATGLASAVEDDSSLSSIMEAYTDGDGIVRLDSFSLNPTSYRAITSSAATETIVIGTNNNGTQDFANYGGRQFQYNNLNELVSVSPGGMMPFQGTANKALQSASVASNVVSISQHAPSATTYTLPQNSTATEVLFFTWPLNGNSQCTLSGAVTTGDVVSFVVKNALLPGGQEQINYTVLLGDNLDSIASGLTAAVNNDINLANLGIKATAGSATISVSQPSTSYSWSSSSGATESLFFGATNNGNVEATVYGTPTGGDTLTITVNNDALSAGESSASYTVTSSDSLMSIAAGLAAAITADTDLVPLGLTVANTSPGVFRWSQAFTAGTPITSYSPTEMSGTDGVGNVGSVDYTMFVQGATSYPSYDFNGNMTSDGTNTYAYDAENRLIQIDYPGTGNYSEFAYDGFGRNVQIQEYNAGTLENTRNFLWSRNTRLESRNTSGAIIGQFFSRGEILGGINYFFTLDHLGSIREITDASENIQGQLSYDPYGRVTQLQGTLLPDFGFAGYYMHAPSALNLTLTRAYSPSQGRFINRDIIAEAGGENLYAYTNNNPISFVDPFGLQSTQSPEPATPEPPNNQQIEQEIQQNIQAVESAISTRDQDIKNLNEALQTINTELNNLRAYKLQLEKLKCPTPDEQAILKQLIKTVETAEKAQASYQERVSTDQQDLKTLQNTLENLQNGALTNQLQNTNPHIPMMPPPR